MNNIIHTHFNDGSVIPKCPTLNGVKHGKDLLYNRDGSVLIEREFVNGVLHGKEIAYYPSRNVYWERGYENDLLEGRHIQYYDTASKNIKYELAYKLGKGIPPHKTYSIDGKLKFDFYLNFGPNW